MAGTLCLPIFSNLSGEPICVRPSDVLLPTREVKVDERKDLDAFRLRVEALAERYVTGQSLFIQTAALRGPFTNDWLNPWALEQTTKSEATRRRRAKLARSHLDKARSRREQHESRKIRAQALQADGLGRSLAQPVDLTDDIRVSSQVHSLKITDTAEKVKEIALHHKATSNVRSVGNSGKDTNLLRGHGRQRSMSITRTTRATERNYPAKETERLRECLVDIYLPEAADQNSKEPEHKEVLQSSGAPSRRYATCLSPEQVDLCRPTDSPKEHPIYTKAPTSRLNVITIPTKVVATPLKHKNRASAPYSAEKQKSSPDRLQTLLTPSDSGNEDRNTASINDCSCRVQPTDPRVFARALSVKNVSGFTAINQTEARISLKSKLDFQPTFGSHDGPPPVPLFQMPINLEPVVEYGVYMEGVAERTLRISAPGSIQSGIDLNALHMLRGGPQPCHSMSQPELGLPERSWSPALGSAVLPSSFPQGKHQRFPLQHKRVMRQMFPRRLMEGVQHMDDKMFELVGPTYKPPWKSNSKGSSLAPSPLADPMVNVGNSCKGPEAGGGGITSKPKQKRLIMFDTPVLKRELRKPRTTSDGVEPMEPTPSATLISGVAKHNAGRTEDVAMAELARLPECPEDHAKERVQTDQPVDPEGDASSLPECTPRSRHWKLLDLHTNKVFPASEGIRLRKIARRSAGLLEDTSQKSLTQLEPESDIIVESPPLVSTQAAMLEAQQAFQEGLDSPIKSSTRTVGVELTSYEVAKACNITPFRNLHNNIISPVEQRISQEGAEISTQALFDAFQASQEGSRTQPKKQKRASFGATPAAPRDSLVHPRSRNSSTGPSMNTFPLKSSLGKSSLRSSISMTALSNLGLHVHNAQAESDPVDFDSVIVQAEGFLGNWDVDAEVRKRSKKGSLDKLWD